MASNDLLLQPQKGRVMQGTRRFQDSILKTKYSWQGRKLLMGFYIWCNSHCSQGTFHLRVMTQLLQDANHIRLHFSLPWVSAYWLGQALGKEDELLHALVWGSKKVVLGVGNVLRKLGNLLVGWSKWVNHFTVGKQLYFFSVFSE